MSSITFPMSNRYWLVFRTAPGDPLVGIYTGNNRETAILHATFDADLLGNGDMKLRDSILSGDCYRYDADGDLGQLDAVEFKIAVRDAIERKDHDHVNELLRAGWHYAPARYGAGAAMPPDLFIDYRPLREYASSWPMHGANTYGLRSCEDDYCPLCDLAQRRKVELSRGTTR